MGCQNKKIVNWTILTVPEKKDKKVVTTSSNLEKVKKKKMIRGYRKTVINIADALSLDAL